MRGNQPESASDGAATFPTANGDGDGEVKQANECQENQVLVTNV